MSDILKQVEQEGNKRTIDNISRRIMKAGEELGELNEAFLSVTSPSNDKKHYWVDVIGEAVDVAIMGLDIALTPINGLTTEKQEKLVRSILVTKLQKWATQVEEGRSITVEKS
tara:strand:+ start:381 stop:719 length:339 start_codon:yes stop_codon:yes gene_type:complete